MTVQLISPADIAYIDGLIELGVPQRKLAPRLGVHWRTIHAVWNRKGAYAKYPKPMPETLKEFEICNQKIQPQN